MARVKITLTCAHCGQAFEHINFRRNRSEADDYEAWARENIDICPACYRAQKAAEEAAAAEAFAAEHKLPQLKAVSEKQLKYAELLRYRNLSKAGQKAIDKARAIDKNTPEQIAAWEAEYGKPWDQLKQEALRAHGLAAIYACLTETKAGKLLDTIQGR